MAKRSASTMRIYKSKSYRGKVQTGGIHDLIRKKIEERRKSMEANKGRSGSRLSYSRLSQNRGFSVRYEQSNSARDLKSFQFLAHNQRCEDQAGEARCSMLKRRGYCTTHLATKEVECRKTCGLCWNPEERKCN